MAGTINIDCSDEDLSNWMRFVRPADTWPEQNLVLTQEGDKLYFISTRNIHPKQELRVGYSEAYAKARGLPYLSPQSSQLTPSEPREILPDCEFPSPNKLRTGRERLQNRGRSSGQGTGTHVCPICEQTFERQFCLQRHISLHKGEKHYRCAEPGCNAKFSLPFNLTRHKKNVHKAAKPGPQGEIRNPDTIEPGGVGLEGGRDHGTILGLDMMGQELNVSAENSRRKTVRDKHLNNGENIQRHVKDNVNGRSPPGLATTLNFFCFLNVKN